MLRCWITILLVFLVAQTGYSQGLTSLYGLDKKTNTVFIGVFNKGPVNVPVRVKSLTEYKQQFQDEVIGLSDEQLELFFKNGGEEATILRLPVSADTPLLASHFSGSRFRQMGLYTLNKYDEDVDVLVLLNSSYLSRSELIKLQKRALSWSSQRQAFAVLDAPHDSTKTDVLSWQNALAGTYREDLRSGALYFPRLTVGGRKIETAGAIAGQIVANDRNKGVWKSPSGLGTVILGVDNVSATLSVADENQMGTLGINVIKNIPSRGIIIWGARTLAGANVFSDEYKYISVSRTKSLIVKSIRNALEDVVAEYHHTAELRDYVKYYSQHLLYDLYIKGAFNNFTTEQSYYVICDLSSNTIMDEQNGTLNVLIGFASTRPSEFTLLKLQFKTLPAQ